MVAIVLPGPLPRSVEQEALLCMPKGQEVWLTAAEPGERHKHARICHTLEPTIFVFYCLPLNVANVALR